MKKKVIVIFVVVILLFFIFKIFNKNEVKISNDVKYFNINQRCVKNPKFIKEKLKVKNTAIDLTQRSVRGVSLIYNNDGKMKTYVGKKWSDYGSFREYARDKEGNIYLTPVVFINSSEEIFRRQSWIYKIDSRTGKIEEFIKIDGLEATAKNPYALSSIVYDCSTNSLFVGSLAGSNNKEEKGVIYKINLNTKKVTRQYENIDALSLAIIEDNNSKKYLLLGSAKKNNIYLLNFDSKMNIKNEIPLLIATPAKHSNSFDKIYKIRGSGRNAFELKGVEFNYTALASTNSERNLYKMIFNSKKKIFEIVDSISEYNLLNSNK